MRPDGPRDPVAGPDKGPAPPFPLKLSGKVIKGFGRGSKELGIPTANIPLSGLSVGGNEELESGIYFGWAGLDFRSSSADSSASSTVDSTTPTGHGQKDKDGVVEEDGEEEEEEEDWEGRGRVFPMVMSVGWNPFYKNEVRSVEVHIMHRFPHDFYGAHMNLLMLGFVRPEYDYVSKESLIDDIRADVEVTRRSLARPAYARFKYDRYLLTFPEGVAGGEGEVDATKGDVAS